MAGNKMKSVSQKKQTSHRERGWRLSRRRSGNEIAGIKAERAE